MTLSRKINDYSDGRRYIKNGYDNDFLTTDDVKHELMDIGVNGDNDIILQALSQSSVAIVEIIISINCVTDEDVQTVLLWLRKYYSIENRRYNNINERNNYEAKLFAYMIEIGRKFNVNVQKCGIDVDNQLIPLSYGDLKASQDSLCELLNATIDYSDSSMTINLPSKIVSQDVNICAIIERLFDVNLQSQDGHIFLTINNKQIRL